MSETTHEEVRQALRDENWYMVIDYITQQEKRDEIIINLKNIIHGYLAGRDVSQTQLIKEIMIELDKEGELNE